MAKVAKRLQKIREGVDTNKLYALADAVSMVKERAVAKFDETIEISMNLGVDPRYADQMVRGVVNLPNGGTIEFDRCIATPDMMPLVGRLGKVLGPRSLMPNPKVGTVTPDVAAAVKASKGGAVEFRVEKAGIVHAGVGKASFGAQQIVENVKAFADAVLKAKPTGAKGEYLKKVSISSTMGVGVKVDLVSIRSE